MTAHSGLMIDYLGSGTHAARPAAPNIGSGIIAIYFETDTLNTFASSAGTWYQLNGAGTGGPGGDGWIAAEAWTYVSADGPTGVFSAAADVTAKYQAGMRVKYTQSATVKYGIITAVSTYSGGITSLTIYGGTDYTLANAAISATYYSFSKAPFGFNGSPSKWTESLKDTTLRIQSSPAASTWYNPGSLSLSIPIGIWDVSYEVALYWEKAVGSDTQATLSTANNSQSDIDFTAIGYHSVAGGGNDIAIIPVHREKVLTLAAKTSYYLNLMSTGSPTDINEYNAVSPAFIRAKCAYL